MHVCMCSFYMHLRHVCVFDVGTKNWTGGYNTNQIHKNGLLGGWEKRGPPL